MIEIRNLTKKYHGAAVLENASLTVAPGETVARALALQPRYLLYDEPTSALDNERSRAVWLLMAELARAGQAQLIVTHQEEIQSAIPCRVIRMGSGQILSQTKRI